MRDAAAQVAGRIILGQAQQQGQFGLFVQLQPLRCAGDVRRHRHIGQAQQGMFKTQQAGGVRVALTQADTSGQTEIAVGEGGEDRTAVDFHTQPANAVGVVRSIGLQTQAG